MFRDAPFIFILAIFLFVFFRISAVFMLFLRSSSFANSLLLDKSAFYLTANHYHSGGRREAERKHDLFTAFWHPAAFVSIFAGLALCCKGDGSMAQFGDLPKIAAFCGVQQWRLQS